ncbi:MAG TPA: triphosphoribosyl-dephospho-CoA synthase, partial [Ideonella sp.]|nr:triphosphoribosyl-dephospho-CoA synthase [Ideonella sp.]
MQPDARACFLRACALDVAVPKPGNVSLASPGHGMQAAQFLASAQAAAQALFRRGVPVGERIEAAMAASWAAAGCNTNLGILLLCAPVAVAVEHEPGPHTAASLRGAIETVLAGLDRADAAAAFRGIALANPGGLGRADAQDVREAPSVTLREAMALAAGRDLIARQYLNGYAELFELGLHSLPPAFSLQPEAAEAASADAAT